MKLIRKSGSLIWITGNNEFKYFDTTHVLGFNKKEPEKCTTVKFYFRTKSEAEEVHNYLGNLYSDIVKSTIFTGSVDKDKEKLYEEEMWYIEVRGIYSFLISTTPDVLEKIYIELRKLGYKTIWRYSICCFIIV